MILIAYPLQLLHAQFTQEEQTVTSETAVKVFSKEVLQPLLQWLEERGVSKKSQGRIIAQFDASHKASIIIEEREVVEKIKADYNTTSFPLPFTLRFSHEFEDGSDLAIRPK